MNYGTHSKIRPSSTQLVIVNNSKDGHICSWNNCHSRCETGSRQRKRLVQLIEVIIIDTNSDVMHYGRVGEGERWGQSIEIQIS